MTATAVTSVEKRPYTPAENRLFLDQFARSLRAENKSPATVYTYASAVAQFAEHLTGKGMPAVAEQSAASTWRASLSTC